MNEAMHFKFGVLIYAEEH